MAPAAVNADDLGGALRFFLEFSLLWEFRAQGQSDYKNRRQYAVENNQKHKVTSELDFVASDY
jgi:hypothetical protein